MQGMSPAPSPDWRARLDATLRAHGVDVPDAAPRLGRVLELLAADPTAPTTVTAPLDGVDVHITDSLAALTLPAIREARRIADLGTGAGFPGLPLAVALPHAHVDLVESLGRKCAFLERAVAAAEVANAAVVCVRAEEWAARDVDVVTVRAVAPLAVLAEYAAPLLREGGVLVAWKGVRDAAEEAGGDAAAEILGLERAEVVALPGRRGADHRTLHLYRKVRPTPERFPRRAGMARKRPLSG
jgi:16S rRNA (guanine527-N7)-methyltransferase